MIDVNKVILMGRLGADPVQRQTKAGFNVVSFSVATSRRKSSRPKTTELSTTHGDTVDENPADRNEENVENGENSGPANPPSENTRNEETQWHHVSCWGKQGQACALYLKKGSAVYLEGSLRYRQYDDKKGIKRTRAEVYVDTVSFLNNKSRLGLPS